MSAAPACGVLAVRGDARPFALVGAWAGGGAIVGSEPLRHAGAADDPLALLDDQPPLADGDGEVEVGGGWFGYLGYDVARRIERLPASPGPQAAMPAWSLAFYDHVLRCDAAGRWWFEALATPEREPALRARARELHFRLLALPPAPPDMPSPLRLSVAANGLEGHRAAVADGIARIAAGELSQVNLCLRLDGRWRGDAASLFAAAAHRLAPARAAFLADGDWSIASLSPELFLQRRGRAVLTAPIKGTSPRAADPVESAAQRTALARSEKDRAENVMIADLMRNDLGRVCRFGSVRVLALAEPEPHSGVWHLVSQVGGELRDGVGDADLLRATFPPGSVTGAPKIQAMKVIAALEASAREVYTGAIGFAGPLAGLELSVAIRTFEQRGDRVWLGVGGGVVADSDPSSEVRECLAKAAPLLTAAGAELAARRPRHGRTSLPAALAGGGSRPDPREGLFETILVEDGRAPVLGRHLARLATSVRLLYGAALPPATAEQAAEAAARAGTGRARMRLAAQPGGEGVEVTTELAPATPAPAGLLLAPVEFPGGLGRHKWRDRRLVDRLAVELRAVPLLVDLDGEVLEAAWANVWALEGSCLVTPPADGRLLAGVTRDRALALAPAHGFAVAEEPLSLERLVAADHVLLSSAVRGLAPASLRGSRAPLVPPDGLDGLAAALAAG